MIVKELPLCSFIFKSFRIFLLSIKGITRAKKTEVYRETFAISQSVARKLASPR